MQDDAQPNPPGAPTDERAQLRARAVALLKTLRAAKAETEAYLASTQREDAMSAVRGTSSFDEAIAEAQHTIDVIDRAAHSSGERPGERLGVTTRPGTLSQAVQSAG